MNALLPVTGSPGLQGTGVYCCARDEGVFKPSGYFTGLSIEKESELWNSMVLCRYTDAKGCKGVAELRLLDQLVEFLVRESTAHFSCTHSRETLESATHPSPAHHGDPKTLIVLTAWLGIL